MKMQLKRSSLFVCLGLASTAASVAAFSPNRLPMAVKSPTMPPLRSTTVEKPEVTTKSSTEEPTSWECDEDAQCVEVPACNDEECRTSLDVRIHGEWYDLSGKFLFFRLYPLIAFEDIQSPFDKMKSNLMTLPYARLEKGPPRGRSLD